MKFLRNLVFLCFIGALASVLPSFEASAQTKYYCRNFEFYDGKVLGRDRGGNQYEVKVKILQNRVYAERNGVLETGKGIYYGMDNTSGMSQEAWGYCVNASDPLVNGANLLGAQVGDAIPCNGKLIKKNTWLNYYEDTYNPSTGLGDNYRTFNIAKIDRGVLRIHGYRMSPNSMPSAADLAQTPQANGINYNNSLLEAGWYDGVHGHDNPDEPTLKKVDPNEIAGCIFADAVNYADCSSNPVIGAISSVTQTGLSFTFSGFTGGVFTKLDWVIKPSVANVANERFGQVNNPSQGGTNFSFASLPTGEYTLEVQGGDCNSSTSTKTFTIGNTNPCSENPVIGTISSITQTALTFSFTGNGLPNLTWRIKNSANTTTLQSGKTGAVNNAGVTLSFGSLAYGDYILEIEGGDCSSSVSSKAFTISKPNCTAPPVISLISNKTTTGLKVNFTGAISAGSVDWVIKNSSSQTVASGNKSGIAGSSFMDITFPFLANASYTLEVIAVDCISTASSQPFQQDIPKPNCDSGPRITSITQVTNSSLQLLFDGSGVGSIAWKILNAAGTSTMANGEVVPVHNHPTLPYNLANGVYILEIQGGTTCSSTPVSKAFGINTALPIYISNFDGVAKKEGVALSWNVVSEKNGEGFQVLRFDDNAKTPQIIASIPLREEKIGTYSYLDENPASGSNYYQLKQIDTDGSFTTSRIINVSFDGVYGMFMAPNPAKEFVDVEFESRINGAASFETYSNSGIRVMNSRQKVKIGKNKIRMNVSGLSEGSYILKMENGDAPKSLRFLKVN